MQTSVHEIADRTYRLSTCVPDVAPEGFTVNQYLVVGDEPLLFHTGLRGMFPLVAEAVGRIIDAARLRWIGFGHVEADECGAMNRWLAAAPFAEVTFNPLGSTSRSMISPTARRDPWGRARRSTSAAT